MSYEKGDRDRADPCKIYVGGNPEMEEDELRGLFAKHGTVEKVWIARSPPGFAFVWLTDERDVADAMRVNAVARRTQRGVRGRLTHAAHDRRTARAQRQRRRQQCHGGRQRSVLA